MHGKNDPIKIETRIIEKNKICHDELIKVFRLRCCLQLLPVSRESEKKKMAERRERERGWRGNELQINSYDLHFSR